jgi:aryl-phospho-beta-D-glucosidase BglC (GH1 family)
VKKNLFKSLTIIMLAAPIYPGCCTWVLAQEFTHPEATTNPSTWKGVSLPLRFKGGRILTQSDFDRAAAVGSNVVRLFVTTKLHSDPIAAAKNFYSIFVDAKGNVMNAANNPGVADLNTAIAMAAKDHLKVIIQMSNTTNGEIWTNQTDWTTLGNLWMTIAIKFKDNPNVLAFDLMNEPDILSSFDPNTKTTIIRQMSSKSSDWDTPPDWTGSPRDYNLQMSTLIKDIRTVDLRRTIIIQGFGAFGSPINFKWLKPIQGYENDKNVVYSFHMYIPASLTFIGQKKFTEKGAKRMAFVYPNDEHIITDAFAPVVNFQRKYNVPIYVGEFGIEDDAIFGDPVTHAQYNGACWMSAVMREMDSNGWGWTFWDFWTRGRIPLSIHDPRYQALASDMKHGVVPDFCTNPPVLDSTRIGLPTTPSP